MATLIIKLIKDKRVSIIIYCAAAVFLVWMYMAMYPAIQLKMTAMNDVFQSYPEGLMKAFGIEQLVFDHLENFLAMEQFGIIWPVMVICFMAGLASYSIAKEIESGTAEVLLARPISRLKVLGCRYLAAVLILLAFTLLSTLIVAPMAAAYNIDYVFASYVKTAMVGFLFGWAFYSASIMFSAMFSEKSKVAMSIGGVAVVMYIFKIVASLVEHLGWMKYLSFFYYFDANEVLVRGNIQALSIIVFIGVIILCSATTAWYFQKRDIAV